MKPTLFELSFLLAHQAVDELNFANDHFRYYFLRKSLRDLRFEKESLLPDYFELLINLPANYLIKFVTHEYNKYPTFNFVLADMSQSLVRDLLQTFDHMDGMDKMVNSIKRSLALSEQA